MAKKIKTIKEVISETVRTVAPGITVEKMQPYYLDTTSLKKQPDPLYRMDTGSNRYYYKFVDDAPVFFTSVTTMIKNTLPTSPHLIKWLADKGGDEGYTEALERAAYGTLLHAECAQLMISGTYDLDKLYDKLKDYLVKENLPQERIKWEDDLKKDILAFAQWMLDYNVKPLAIEIVLCHPADGYAGAIDIVCELDYEEVGNFGEVYASGPNKGQPKMSKQKKRISAIVDIKSGRKGFYESHEIQLAAYREMWNLHFVDCPVFHLYNFSPKDWRSTPSYNFKEQTDSKNIQKLPHLVKLAQVEASKRNDMVTKVSGVIDLTKGLSTNVEELTYAQLITKNRKV